LYVHLKYTSVSDIFNFGLEYPISISISVMGALSVYYKMALVSQKLQNIPQSRKNL